MNQNASGKESIALRLYNRTQRWADGGWANSVVFGWGLLQATFVPGLADMLFVPLALAKPVRAYRLAVVAAMGSTIGSMILYWVGALAFVQLTGAMTGWLGIEPAEMSRMHELLDRYGWMAVFASIMTPLSTKLTSVASGAFHVPFVAFAIALAAGRLTRVFVIAYVIRHGGASRVAKWLKVPS